MNSVLWRGDLATRARIVSGLVLFAYVLFHFLNIGLALMSPDWADAFQDARQALTRTLIGGVILYGALATHVGLALYKLATRSTLRMPLWEALQVSLGLFIPLILGAHIVYTRVAHEVFDVNDRIGWIAVLIWDTTDGWLQAILLLAVWVHACIGLHFWLRLTRWWRHSLSWLIGLSVLVPAFALAGFMVEGRRMRADFADDTLRDAARTELNWPASAEFEWLAALKSGSLRATLAVFALVAAAYSLRRILQRRQSVRISYVDGPQITVPKGATLLEMSRAAGVPHTALCGGRGRCSTCRVVIEEGAESLEPPDEAEARTLEAVQAPPGTRLACQIRPTHPVTVFRVFRPDGRRTRAHAGQGQERNLAILFLDMRGFTARTTGALPYDVVFLLNRFFDAIVPPIFQAGGTVDKYLGDGLLAVFETADAQSSARTALRAAIGIGEALDAFNETLEAEGAHPVRIGMGLHLGTLVLGEIGAAGHAPRTLIGDTVNTASRLEGETKEMGVEVLVSASLLEAAGFETPSDQIVSLNLRGRTEPLDVLPLVRATDLRLVLDMASANAESGT